MTDVMPTARMAALGEGRYALEGELRFSTVSGIDDLSKAFFTRGADVEIDLAGVTRCDSAALALLLEWTGRAQRGGATLRFRNLPASLLAIAAISEVEDLLPGAD